MGPYDFTAVDHSPPDRFPEFSVLRNGAIAIQGLRRISANDVENILTEGAGFRQKLYLDIRVDFGPGTWSTGHQV